MTADAINSGMICFENATPTANVLSELFEYGGIQLDQSMIWNAYPWFRHGKDELRAADLRLGVEPLRRIIALLPQLKVVLLHGGNAKQVGKYFAQAHPDEAKG